MLWIPWRSKIDSHPKFGLDIETDDTTHSNRVWKSYYSYNNIFWGEQTRPHKLVWKWLDRAEKGDWLWVFMVVRGEPWQKFLYMVWTSHWCQRRKHLCFLTSLTRCGAEGEEYRVRLKIFQQSHIKIWIRLFISW